MHLINCEILIVVFFCTSLCDSSPIDKKHSLHLKTARTDDRTRATCALRKFLLLKAITESQEGIWEVTRHQL